MATPFAKLADALEALHNLQTNGSVAIRSADLSRTHRERLVQNGFLGDVIKGWYVPARPGETRGESTAWYASFWQFCAAYLNHLKGDDWCLSPEQSIALHTENMTVPKQLLVRATKARNNVTELPHGTSLLDIRAALPEPAQVTTKNGLRIYSLPAALIACNKQNSSIFKELDLGRISVSAKRVVNNVKEIRKQLNNVENGFGLNNPDEAQLMSKGSERNFLSMLVYDSFYKSNEIDASQLVALFKRTTLPVM